MAFQFSLQSVLRYRRHQLDQCQQLMAEVIRDQQTCQRSREQNQADRATQLAVLQNASVPGAIDVRELAALRVDLSESDRRDREFVAHAARYQKQLQLCQQAVQKAQAAVKALEKLEEKQRREYDDKELKKAEHVLQEAWTSGQFARRS